MAPYRVVAVPDALRAIDGMGDGTGIGIAGPVGSDRQRSQDGSAEGAGEMRMARAQRRLEPTDTETDTDADEDAGAKAAPSITQRSNASVGVVGLARGAGGGALVLCLVSALIVALAPTGAVAQSGTSDPLDREGTYDYSVIDADLRRVLTDLGGNLGIAVNVDPAITGRAVGPLPTTSARAFLDRLAAINNLAYFYDGQVLHVTPAGANESRLVALDEVSFSTLRNALDSLGVLDERFALRASGDGTVALAAGPPRYVALVEATLAALSAARPERSGETAPTPPVVLAPPRPDPAPPETASPETAPRRPPLVVFRGAETQVLPDGRPSQ